MNENKTLLDKEKAWGGPRLDGVGTGVCVRDTHPLTIASNEHQPGYATPSLPSSPNTSLLPPNGNRAREYGGVMFLRVAASRSVVCEPRFKPYTRASRSRSSGVADSDVFASFTSYIKYIQTYMCTGELIA
ncbi:hypothetical protein QTP88_012415 [Uroleucon formosanum]